MATPNVPYTLPKRPTSDRWAALLGLIAIAAAVLGVPAETAENLTEDLQEAINLAIALGGIGMTIAGTVRAIWHARLQAQQVSVAAPAYVDPDPTDPTEVPPLPEHLR